MSFAKQASFELHWLYKFTLGVPLFCFTNDENSLYDQTLNCCISLSINHLCHIYRGSYMSAHVLLNLLNKLGKSDKMRGLPQQVK